MNGPTIYFVDFVKPYGSVFTDPKARLRWVKVFLKSHSWAKVTPKGGPKLPCYV